MGTEWTWRPELGRWSLEGFGLPGRPAFVEIGTNLVDQNQAYDFWRQIAFTDFTADPGPREERVSFRAKGRGLTWDGADFFHTQSGAVSGHRDRHHADEDGLDSFSVGLVLAGTRKAELEGGAQTVAGAGGFFVYDARRASRVEWSDHQVMYLVIRRAEVRAALGGGEPDIEQMQAHLARSPLQHVVRDQFQLAARHMRTLDSAGRALLLKQIKQSTLMALAGSSEADQAAGSALFQAAIHYIQSRLTDPHLSADHIARALGCSRATLYRAFAASGAGIAETIRDLRLDGVRRALEAGEVDTSVADIAARFGLYDTANFSRQFRRRFGMPPTEIVPRRPR